MPRLCSRLIFMVALVFRLGPMLEAYEAERRVSEGEEDIQLVFPKYPLLSWESGQRFPAIP